MLMVITVACEMQEHSAARGESGLPCLRDPIIILHCSTPRAFAVKKPTPSQPSIHIWASPITVVYVWQYSDAKLEVPFLRLNRFSWIWLVGWLEWKRLRMVGWLVGFFQMIRNAL
jgi:hypothetical protein